MNIKYPYKDIIFFSITIDDTNYIEPDSSFCIFEFPEKIKLILICYQTKYLCLIIYLYILEIMQNKNNCDGNNFLRVIH